MAVGSHLRSVDLLRRALATGAAALIFALGLCAVCPALHQQLHPSAGSSLDEGCVVLLFANGVSVPVAITALPPPPPVWIESSYVACTAAVPVSPRFLLLPGRGPPVA